MEQHVLPARSVIRDGKILIPLMTYKRLHPAAIHPVKKHFYDAGFDLATPFDVTVHPTAPCLISTGLSFRFPHGTYGRIAPRSSTSLLGTMVGAGVIDFTYTGEVIFFASVILFVKVNIFYIFFFSLG